MAGKEYHRAWYWANRDAILKRLQERRRKHREAQAARPKPIDNRCEVCRKQAQRLLWDHGHKSKRFRGWLCPRCNFICALAKDSPKLLREFALYIELGVHYFE